MGNALEKPHSHSFHFFVYSSDGNLIVTAVDFAADKASIIPQSSNRCCSRPQIRIENKISLFARKPYQPFDALHTFNRGVVNSVFLLPHRIVSGFGISEPEPTAIKPKTIPLFWLFYPFNHAALFLYPARSPLTAPAVFSPSTSASLLPYPHGILQSLKFHPYTQFPGFPTP